ncbi:dapB [Wigglesworthia glossinidia endosymbiont of Glossina brevipalpis]|uniref:4-hydroxy-tetrahydrodipicolinate reductase n=1 Tax=Wigglesworthia glossinidia brevipalpis TaxID=36870 RepID=DAPB_WIGBR|nr:RecName: Full=4-hydroxy-tetrahydrodipicolinate reductase; Short=HTPA reductase [Wigglesworthia glossinidia endosymbiont of Glossina brevipalpis]BAC24171.1 dapB [Wigglesworthia glossinidia endosymbiont of Glossina brevipalpis]
MKNNKKISSIRIATTGANGKMGKQITRTAINISKIIHTSSLVRHKSSFKNYDIGKLANIFPIGVFTNDNIKDISDKFDVLIDFTSVKSSLEYLNFCYKNKKKMVIGTTGFNAMQNKLIKHMSKKIAIFYSENFSFGANIIFRLLKNISSIGNIKNIDIDIIECHHKEKSDIPSATSILIKKNILKNLKIKKNIKISSIRSGNIIGEHKIIFSFLGEKIEITHQAYNRKIFALGAIKAAIWLSNKKTGLFNMSHILNKQAKNFKSN